MAPRWRATQQGRPCQVNVTRDLPSNSWTTVDNGCMDALLSMARFAGGDAPPARGRRGSGLVVFRGHGHGAHAALEAADAGRVGEGQVQADATLLDDQRGCGALGKVEPHVRVLER